MNIPSVGLLGFDTWVDDSHINKHYGSTDWMQIQSTHKSGLLWMPAPVLVLNRTVGSAILTGHAHGTLSTQTLTVVPVTRQWDAQTATWKNQPGKVVGVSVTEVLGSTVPDGGEVVIDVTTLVQRFADGHQNFGWMITTDASTVQKFATFDSGSPAWRLDISYIAPPDPPIALSPNGTVVSVPLPVATFDYTTFGGDDSDLAEIQFQIDVGNNGTVDYTSAWIPSVDPQISLSPSVTAPSAGDTLAYRIQVQDADSQPSGWSDWATYTYRPLPTLTLDSPAGGVMFDPTSDVLAHISTSHLAAYRIQITDGDDRTAIRYDTGKTQADDPSDIAEELPLKNAPFGGTRIFTDDDDFQIHVRAFDDYDREATPGAPAHVDLWTTVHFDDDLSLDPVTSYRVTQVDQSPFLKHTWTDLAAGDAYVISRDGDQIARLAPEDTISGPDSFTYVEAEAEPYVQHVYAVRRLTNGVGRSAPRRAASRVKPEGIWLLRDNGDSVVIDDLGIDQLSILERRLTFTPLHIPYDVDILTAYEGISGPVTGSIEDADDQTVHRAKQVLDAIKKNPTEVVRFIAATISKPVQVSQIDVQPDPDFREDMNRHTVKFNIKQVGEFDYSVGGSGGGTAGKAGIG